VGGAPRRGYELIEFPEAMEVYRDTHDQASTSGDDDQHQLLPRRWMISRRVPRRMWRPPMIIYSNPVGLVSRAAGRPRETGVAAAPAVSPREAASTRAVAASRANLPLW
jgi:hypothetical protein